MGKKLSELVEATSALVTDIFHLRTSGGIDKKITFANFLISSGVKIGNNTRSTAGDQIISGVGFQSSVILFLAIDSIEANPNASWGVDNGVIHMSIGIFENGIKQLLSTDYSIYVSLTDIERIYGYVSAVGSDGFTITWAKVGARAADFIYICLP